MQFLVSTIFPYYFEESSLRGFVRTVSCFSAFPFIIVIDEMRIMNNDSEQLRYGPLFLPCFRCGFLRTRITAHGTVPHCYLIYNATEQGMGTLIPSTCG